jgi:hypothetical protein
LLDLKLIRSDPERVKAALARRGAGAQVDELLALDGRRRELLPEIENAQAERKTLSKQIGERKQAGEDAAELMATVQGLKEKIETGKAELETVDAGLGRIATALPNLPDPDSPDGMTEEDAVVVREVGELPSFDFPVRDHLEIGTELGLIDMEAGARLSGSRFAYLKGDLVMLELALVRFALELVRGEGHEPVVPPVLVREEALEGTGFLPGDRDQIYEIEKDELFLTGTSEVALQRLLHLLPPRGRRRRARHARDLPRPPVRQGRDVLVRRAGAVRGRARTAAGDRGADPRRARDPLPGGQRRRRGPWRPSREEVRLRGLDPEPGALPRAHLLLEHDRLPGAPHGLPLPPRRGRRGGPRTYAEWHRMRRRTHDHCPDGEPARRGRRFLSTKNFASIRLP